MSKIAKIEISDFRIYQDKQTFSFEQDGEIANLVVLYAPNGYGKTSFFDAVEWLYSDQIGRFGHPIIQEEITRKDFAKGNQILLTNRKSYEHNKAGEVQITTSDGKSAKRRVDIRKINNREQYHDYRPGVFQSDDYKAEQLQPLPHTNFLTQDQIDVFLRYTTPQEKFKALSKFWKEGDRAITIMNQITGYLRVLENGKNRSMTRKKELEDAIAKLLNTESNIERLNVALQEHTNDSSLQFKAAQVVHPVTEVVYDTLKETVLSFQRKGQRVLQQASERAGRLQQLLESIDQYLTEEGQLLVLAEQFKTLGGLEKLYVDQTALVREKETNNQQLLSNTLLKQKLQRLIALWPKYQEVARQLITAQAELTALLRTNDEILTNAAAHKTGLDFLERQRSKWLDDLKTLKYQTDNYLEDYGRLTFWRKEYEQRKKQQQELSERKVYLQQRIDSLTSSRQHWEQIISWENISLLTDSEKTEAQRPLAEMSAAQVQLLEMRADLERNRNQLEQSGSLNEDLDKILNWGEEYVTATNTSNCPLCQTAFASMAALLERVRADKPNVLNMEAQRAAIGKLEERIGAQNQRYNEAKESILTTIRSWLVRCQEDLSKALNDRNKMDEDLSHLAEQIYHANEQIVDFSERVSIQADDLEDSISRSPEEIKLILESRLLNLQKKEVRLRGLIEIKRGRWATADSLSVAGKNRQVALENDLDLYRSESSYTGAMRLAAELEVDQAAEPTIIDRRLAQVQQTIDEAEKNVELIDASIEALKGELRDHPLSWSETELPGKKLEVTNEIDRLNGSVGHFKQSFETDLPQAKIENKTIAEALKHNQSVINSLANELTGLDHMLILVELITENVNKGKFEEEIVTIDGQLAQITVAEAKLSSALEDAIRYINKEINNYFSSDAINQIYSRIEPHPDLNMIEFLPEVAGKNFVVDIRASGGGDALNPVLYLSAGQLNILSLSIFLATIFESGSEVISTIFMDEPVQNLSDINILSFIDLIRSMIVNMDKQIVISTHDEHFFKLIQNKIPTALKAKYIELDGFGTLK